MAGFQAGQRVHPLAPVAADLRRDRVLAGVPHRLRGSLLEEGGASGRVLGVHGYTYRGASRADCACFHRHAPQRRVLRARGGVPGVQAGRLLVLAEGSCYGE